MKYFRMANALRIIADKMDNVYVTKRVEGKFLELITDATRVSMWPRNYSNDIELHIEYPDTRNYNDWCVFTICSTENRRIDGAKLREKANDMETWGCKTLAQLSQLDAAVALYNDVADRYAQIYEYLHHSFSDLPYADYWLQDKYRGQPLPELPGAAQDAAEPVQEPQPEPVPDPIPLPVQPVENYTMDEFLAMVSGS